MTRIIIKRLCDAPEWAAQCQTWDEAEWPRDPNTPDMADFFADHYAEAAKNHGATLPQTFIALRGDKIIGMLSLIAEDHPDLLHLTPWIASGFVVPSERQSRAFYLLTQAAHHYSATALSLPYLYCYTHLSLQHKGCELLGDITDPFDAQKIVQLYRYAPHERVAIKRS